MAKSVEPVVHAAMSEPAMAETAMTKMQSVTQPVVTESAMTEPMMAQAVMSKATTLEAAQPEVTVMESSMSESVMTEPAVAEPVMSDSVTAVMSMMGAETLRRGLCGAQCEQNPYAEDGCGDPYQFEPALPNHFCASQSVRLAEVPVRFRAAECDLNDLLELLTVTGLFESAPSHSS